MATSTKTDHVALTTMAAREILLIYFRGTCVERTTVSPQLALRADSYPASFQYQRIDGQMVAPATLLFDNVPIATVTKMPKRIRLNNKVLERSPQFRQFKEELLMFLEKYMPEVEVVMNERREIYA